MTKDDYRSIARVVERATECGLCPKSIAWELSLDLELTHDSNPLDFNALLGFDSENFGHDVVGIYNNIDRENKVLGNCFLPRCTKH